MPPAAPDPGGAARAGLHRRLVWLNVYRLTLDTVLLGGTAAIGLSGHDRIAEPLYALVLLTFVAALGVALALRGDGDLTVVAWVQLGIDLVIAAAVVAATGFAESVFVFLFLLAIVNGGIVLYRRGASAAAAIAITAHVGFAAAFGDPGTRAGTYFAQAAAFVATAALSTYLSELLRTTGERLAARESDLAAMTALHESIVESVTSGLLTVDAEGNVTFLNRAGAAMTGIPRGQVIGQPAARWFSAFRTDTARGEVDLAAASGAVLRVGYSSFPLLRPDGRRIGAAVIFQDLTELREMEERVARSERLADLGGVAAGLAHELRNPLASMSGSVELLRQNPGLSGDDRRLMDIVLREAERLDQLVTQFLAFARPAEPRRVPTDLARVAEDALEVFGHDPAAAGVAVERDLAPAPADADPDQLRQVIWNLLRNAAEAARREAGGGKVRVATRTSPAGEAVLDVEDDGPGITAEDRARLFLPFFTTKRQGTGLGLATVHRIVDAHGGIVSVDSAPGAGARFSVLLPPRRPAPRA